MVFSFSLIFVYFVRTFGYSIIESILEVEFLFLPTLQPLIINDNRTALFALILCRCEMCGGSVALECDFPAFKL